MSMRLSSRAGSHAGRGFRYQDAVAAWLAIEGWSGRLPYGLVIPEGHDDVELGGTNLRVLAQVKSRRDHLGPFSITTVAKFVEALWARDGASDGPPERFLLILESQLVTKTAATGVEIFLSAYSEAVKLLSTHPKASTHIERTRIMIAPNPMEAGVSEIAHSRACTALEAQTYYSVLVQRVGRLADENGLRPVGGYLGLSKSDVQAEFDTLQSVLTSRVIEAALEQGICEAVDFITPAADPLFYLGVDVQPSHLAAGLLVERPDLRREVVRGLEERRNVLIRGPSGAGKSALMWEAAHSVRHVVRWFRVRRLTPEIVPLLVQMARGCRASVHAPVGFALDDVGRGLSDGWSALAREVEVQPGFLLLGTIREEDLYPVQERAKAVEVRAIGDDEFARRVWEELRSRGQTQWAGWAEAWTRAKGLLLEYVHILTQGTRLSKTLDDQVAVRATDPSREVELDVLRVAAAASAAGAVIEAQRLPTILNRPPAEVSRALQRLLDEHLLREAGPGQIGGLHELRSCELFRLSHQFPPPIPAQTLAAAVQVLPDDDIGVFLARTLEREPAHDETLLDATAARLAFSREPRAAAAAFRGLGQLQILRTIDQWLASEEVKAIPATQVAFSALFGVSGIEIPKFLQQRPEAAAARLLRKMKEAAAVLDPRTRLLARLPPTVIQDLLTKSVDITTLNAILTALVGQSSSEDLCGWLSDLQPDLLHGGLKEVAGLLATATLVNPRIAKTWVRRVGQEQLLRRLEHETPWISPPELREESEGLAVCADIRYVAPSHQPDAHEAVVELCELMFAVVPDAELTVSNAVGADGNIAGFGDYQIATKRIKRENLPPAALPAWNKRWRMAVDDRLAPVSYTSYLARASDLLERLTITTEGLLDNLFRTGKPKEPLLKTLGDIHRASRTLTAPSSSQATRVRHSDSNSAADSKLQKILFDCSADLLSRFAKLPQEALVFISWSREILKDIDAATREEPWALIGLSSSKALAALRQLVEDLRSMAGETHLVSKPPLSLWQRRRAQRGTAFHLACLDVRQRTSRRLSSVRDEVQHRLDALDLKLTAHTRTSLGDIPLWPPADVLITVALDGVEEWLPLVDSQWPSWREAAGADRDLTVVPVVNGRAVDTFTLGGYDSATPRAGTFRDWSEQIRIEVLRSPRADAFSAVVDALSEISGIQEFGYGTERRPVIEQRALSEAQARLDQAIRNLGGLMVIAPEITAAIDDFVDQVRTGVVRLARDTAAMLHGQPTATISAVVGITLALTAEDLKHVP